jgi:bifunctional ADP-heptose synthase (sugar kinase/adenylyltransferase)
MIIDLDGLALLRGAVTMVDGGFDPLHGGHIAYVRAAATLGLPVLCNLAPDAWIAQKHPPLLPQEERACVVDALRDVNYVFAARISTADVLERLRPRYYAKGADWRGKLPYEELSVCANSGVEVVYLDTVTNSSSALLERYERRVADAGR